MKEVVNEKVEEVKSASDKKSLSVLEILQKYPEGLSLGEIMSKSGLSEGNVENELKKLEQDGKLGNSVEMQKEVKKGKSFTEQVPVVKTSSTKPTISSEVKQKQILEQRAPLQKIAEKIPEKKIVENKNYVKTGIQGFDDLLEKGIPRGNSILVAGGAGSGKTLFCLQVLGYHASQGKKCFYMSFEENENKLKKHMQDFGWNADELIEKGNLKMQRINPFDISRSVDAMLAKQKGELLIEVDPIIIPKDFKPDFIVVDSLTSIASTFVEKEESYRIYIEQLFRFFEKLDATSFLITETKQIPEIFSTTGVEEFLADGVIVFYNIKRGTVREKAMEILKLRGAKHQRRIVAMAIEDKVGIKIYPEQEIFGGIS